MAPKIPHRSTVDRPALLALAATLNPTGVLKTLEKERYSYLDIDDDFIHLLYPLLRDETIQKPNYFGGGLIGAHISVIYPEEYCLLKNADRNQEHIFQVTGLCYFDTTDKRYFALTLIAPTLLALRQQYQLPPQLCFRDYWLDLHITIGVTAIS